VRPFAADDGVTLLRDRPKRIGAAIFPWAEDHKARTDWGPAVRTGARFRELGSGLGSAWDRRGGGAW
jgi:hypothetical protein